MAIQGHRQDDRARRGGAQHAPQFLDDLVGRPLSPVPLPCHPPLAPRVGQATVRIAKEHDRPRADAEVGEGVPRLLPSSRGSSLPAPDLSGPASPSVATTTRTAAPRRTAASIMPAAPRTSSSGCGARTRSRAPRAGSAWNGLPVFAPSPPQEPIATTSKTTLRRLYIPGILQVSSAAGRSSNHMPPPGHLANGEHDEFLSGL